MNDLAKTSKPNFLRAKDVATYFFDGKISYARVLALTRMESCQLLELASAITIRRKLWLSGQKRIWEHQLGMASSKNI